MRTEQYIYHSFVSRPAKNKKDDAVIEICCETIDRPGCGAQVVFIDNVKNPIEEIQTIPDGIEITVEHYKKGKGCLITVIGVS